MQEREFTRGIVLYEPWKRHLLTQTLPRSKWIPRQQDNDFSRTNSTTMNSFRLTNRLNRLILFTRKTYRTYLNKIDVKRQDKRERNLETNISSNIDEHWTRSPVTYKLKRFRHKSKGRDVACRRERFKKSISGRFEQATPAYPWKSLKLSTNRPTYGHSKL